ncbi:MAG: PD-(D/E)XK nuclease family protein [Chloroflexi bacterium]|nr:PD-(D/E)XK nuclease family protein [Chloroflexota bacterium]
MNVQLWYGPWADEPLRAAASELRERLCRCVGPDLLIAVGGSVLGWPVDLALFTSEALLVVRLLRTNGPLTGSGRGHWHSPQGPLAPERPNPVRDLLLARLALLDLLAEQTPVVLGREGDALAWNQAHGRVALFPQLDRRSQLTADVPPKLCRILGFDQLVSEIPRLRPTHAPVPLASVERLLAEGLGLRPDGEPPPAPAGCALCTLHQHPCNLHRLRGTVRAVQPIREGVRLTLQTDDYWTVSLALFSPWNTLAPALEQLCREKSPPVVVAHHLRAGGQGGRLSLSAGSQSLVIVAPELLIDVSAVAEMASCPLAYVIHQFEPKAPSAASVRGKVVHSALRRVVQGEGAAAALAGALQECERDLVFAGLNTADAQTEATPHVSRLATVLGGQPGETETTVSNLLLGLSGRVDALWEAEAGTLRLVELKTGKPTPWGQPRPNHRLQAQLYAACLWQAGRLTFDQTRIELVYTGDEEAVVLSTPLSWTELRQAILTRNEAALFDLTGTPLGEARRCQPCPRFRAEQCAFYADLLGYAPQLLTPNRDRLTFRRWVAALRRDAALQARSELGISRRSVGERVIDGTCFRIEAIEDGGLDASGRWRARLRGRNLSRFRAADRALLVADRTPDRQVSAEIDGCGPDWIDVVADAPAPWATRLEPAGTRSLLQGVFQGLIGWLRAEERLRRLVAGELTPRFGPLPPPDPELDRFQQDAAQRALAACDYLLIWGPPGSGKTRTIARIARTQPGRVLLAAFTNQAVDNLALALLSAGQEQLLVLGRATRSHSELERHTLDALRGEAAIRTALASCPIVLATAAQVASGRYDQALGGTPPFDLVILDEATQLTEPAALGVLRLGKRFVLVGDHKQLAPIVADPTAELGRSLFERLWEEPAAAAARVMLARQYRMREAIAAFSAQQWYEGQLETDPSAEAQPPVVPPAPRWSAVWQRGPAVLVEAPPEQEGEVVATLVAEALQAGLAPEQVGVVAPYRQQVTALAGQLAQASLPRAVVVDTVDRFQGSERDCIILATGDPRRGDLLADERRLNVALTRARRQLFIVGQASRLMAVPVTAELLQFFRQRGWVVTLGE